ncbi:MAG: hypothetical protein IKM87_00225 [Clostridia bacterium]|nr:hypothetical protein [Clostridia bacterium]
MTIKEIKECDRAFLTAHDIADILATNPQAIRNQAQRNPSSLGFNVIVIGSRVKIPRIPFLNYVLGEYDKDISA